MIRSRKARSGSEPKNDSAPPARDESRVAVDNNKLNQLTPR